MTQPTARRRVYSPEERREIVAEARATARALLEKIEMLAQLEPPIGEEGWDRDDV